MVRPKVDCFISPFVIQEISAGDKAAAKKRFDAVGDLPVLEVNKEIQRLAQRYFDALEISEKAKLDASHLAVAVWHEIDYLLSWNCKHIVSGRVKKMLEKINTDLNIVEEVRKQRLRIEVNCENDFDKLFEQAIEIQKKFKNRVVSKPSLEPRLQTPPEVV